eukprot:CFRG1504T1
MKVFEVVLPSNRLNDVVQCTKDMPYLLSLFISIPTPVINYEMLPLDNGKKLGKRTTLGVCSNTPSSSRGPHGRNLRKLSRILSTSSLERATLSVLQAREQASEKCTDSSHYECGQCIGARIDVPNSLSIRFKCKDSDVQKALTALQMVGIGESSGHVSVWETFTEERDDEEGDEANHKNGQSLSSGTISWWPNHARTLSDSEILLKIEERNHVTFDVVGLTLCGGVLNALGLLTSSTPFIVASMLISPLMIPLLGCVWGITTGDSQVIRLSLRRQVKLVSLAFIGGFLMGLLGCMCMYSLSDTYVHRPFYGSGRVTDLLNAGISIPSGVAVGISYTGGAPLQEKLVGVALAASMLRPIVGSAMNLSLGTFLWIVHGETNDLVRACDGAIVSMATFILNYIGISLSAAFVFWMKGVKRPMSRY